MISRRKNHNGFVQDQLPRYRNLGSYVCPNLYVYRSLVVPLSSPTINTTGERGLTSFVKGKVLNTG